MSSRFRNPIGRVIAAVAALVLAVGVVVAGAGTAWADELPEASTEDTVKTITITSPSGLGDNDEVTYTVYKIFNASTAAGSNTAVSYTRLNGDQKDITSQDSLKRFHLDQAGVVHYQVRNSESEDWTDSREATTLDQSMTDAIKAAVNGNRTLYPAVGTVTLTGPSKSKTVKVDDYGYYYITSTTGTVVSIDTTHPTANVQDKNEVPTVVKEEDHPTNDIGDTVTYTVTINAKKGTESLAFHDRLSSGLTLVTDGQNPLVIKYQVGASGSETIMTTGDASGASAITYTQDRFDSTAATANGTGGTATKAGDNIALRFNGDFTEDTTITLTYKATLNSNAKINESNQATIAYGHDSSYESTPKKVYQSTFKFAVSKVTDDGATPLAGAKFVLATDGTLGDLTEDSIANLDDGKKSKLIKVDGDGNVSTAGTNYVVAADDGTNNNTLTFNGLDADLPDGTTYYLYEVKAPDGYNKLTEPIAVKVTPTVEADEGGNNPATQTKVTGYSISYNVNGAIQNIAATKTEDGNDWNAPTVTVRNSSGTVLPSTGGAGTVAFYVVGGVLIVGAVAYLVHRRKANA